MARSVTPQRGEIHWADLAEVGRKLVLVVSPGDVNATLREPIVCLVTSRERERRLDTYARIDPPEGGVWRPSFILCHALLTIQDWRLETAPLGSVSAETLHRVDAALIRALAIAIPGTGS